MPEKDSIATPSIVTEPPRDPRRRQRAHPRRGALAVARVGASQAAHRRHRLRPYRRHHWRALGQSRPSGAVFLAPSRRAERSGRGPRRACASRHRRSGDRVRRRAVHRGALCGAAADRPRLRRGAQRQDHARCLQCGCAARRQHASPTKSSSEGIGVVSQKYLPGARLVRAFNTLNYKIFASEANRPDPKLAVPIAGDDPEAVKTAAGAGARCRLRSGRGRQAC